MWYFYWVFGWKNECFPKTCQLHRQFALQKYFFFGFIEKKMRAKATVRFANINLKLLEPRTRILVFNELWTVLFFIWIQFVLRATINRQRNTRKVKLFAKAVTVKKEKLLFNQKVNCSPKTKTSYFNIIISPSLEMNFLFDTNNQKLRQIKIKRRFGASV